MYIKYLGVYHVKSSSVPCFRFRSRSRSCPPFCTLCGRAVGRFRARLVAQGLRPVVVGLGCRRSVLLRLCRWAVCHVLGASPSFRLSRLCRSCSSAGLGGLAAGGSFVVPWAIVGACCAVIVSGSYLVSGLLSALGHGAVAVAGSRSLPAGGAGVVAGIVQLLIGSGRSIVVGCASGADAAAVSAVLIAGEAGRLQVLAAFGPVSPPWKAARYSAPGAFRASAVSEVAGAALAGVSVVWWAGGGPSVYLCARLAARTRAVVSAASGGLVLFFSSPQSRGSLLAARSAVGRGLPVVAFPLGFSAAQLPALGAGAWSPVSEASAWAWVPGQVGLF